jgi:hypothetical protein
LLGQYVRSIAILPSFPSALLVRAHNTNGSSKSTAVFTP